MWHGRTFMIGLSIMTLVPAGQALAAQDDRTAVVLIVDNYAKVPPPILKEALREASRPYAKIGIRMIWLERAAARASDVDGARQITVLLLCSEMSAQKIKKDGIAEGVLGVAAHEVGRAYIFTGRVLTHSIRQGNPALVLGRVLAHEVGHLLLTERGHSTRGIMSSKLAVFAKGADRFTLAQQEAMQAAFTAQP